MSDDSVATPNPNPTPAPGAATPPPGAAPPPDPGEPPPAAAGTTPYATFPDAESFQKRVERESRKHLKELGITDPAQVKSLMEEHAQFKQAAEEADRAKMGEVERLNTDLAAEKSARENVELQYEEMRVRNHLSGVFAKKGIRNFDYGFFLINKKLDELGDDDELDEEAFLDELTADPSARAALGMEAAPPGEPPPPAQQPATTSPEAPKPPAAGGPATPGAKTAMDMSPEEWVQYKQRMGLST